MSSHSPEGSRARGPRPPLPRAEPEDEPVHAQLRIPPGPHLPPALEHPHHPPLAQGPCGLLPAASHQVRPAVGPRGARARAQRRAAWPLLRAVRPRESHGALARCSAMVPWTRRWQRAAPRNQAGAMGSGGSQIPSRASSLLSQEQRPASPEAAPKRGEKAGPVRYNPAVRASVLCPHQPPKDRLGLATVVRSAGGPGAGGAPLLHLSFSTLQQTYV